MLAQDRGGSPSSLRAIVAYLTGLRPVLLQATQGRQNWVRRIGSLMEDVRHESPQAVAQAAGRIGREHLAVFRESQRRFSRLNPPPACLACHHSLGNWLDKLVASCEVLVEVGRTGNLSRVRETQHILSEGRAHAKKFNAEYSRLVADIRERVNAAAVRRDVAESRRAQVGRRAGSPA